jgi:heme/copper-type cytochrome/quinol oxidase subunit 4
MVRNLARQIPAKVKGNERELGCPFIVGFMLLLMVAAASLSMGLATLADEVAVYAYYALVVGVILQLVCFLKYNRRIGEKDNE